MEKTDFLETSHWSLESLLGFDHPLFHINSETIINTWIVLGIIIAFIFLTRLCLRWPVGRCIIVQFVAFFIDLTKQSFGKLIVSHCVFTASLFIFIALCNIVSVIPWIEEPTKDLNTALALGIIAFIYTQMVIIQTSGIRAYISSFFQPFFVMMPINIVGKLSAVISISFRLFGNIFGGAIITSMALSVVKGSLVWEILFLVSGFNVLLTSFFVLFEGILQAFVFTMLTTTYIAIGAQGEGH